jgi:hypothetical protein
MYHVRLAILPLELEAEWLLVKLHPQLLLDLTSALLRELLVPPAGTTRRRQASVSSKTVGYNHTLLPGAWHC